MKKIYKIGLIVIVVLIIIVGVIFGINRKRNVSLDKDFVYAGLFPESIIEDENYVFTDYEDFKNKFNSNKLKEEDFNKNNYVLVSMRYDECSEEDISPVKYKIDGNDIDILVEYKAKCGVCAAQYMYYLLKVDKDLTSAKVNIEYKSVNKPNCDEDVVKKPLIYLYPENEIDVSIKLKNSKYLTTSYPRYNNSWEVIASPNGDLVDKKTGRKLYGLYWEGKSHNAEVCDDGFVVRGEDTITFLEEKLALLGLTEREANEFIIYWLPQLEKNKYNYIRFETLEEINNHMSLDITPTPDTIIRVVMDYKPLNKMINVKEQIIDTPTRQGFVVVEWGGSLIN